MRLTCVVEDLIGTGADAKATWYICTTVRALVLIQANAGVASRIGPRTACSVRLMPQGKVELSRGTYHRYQRTFAFQVGGFLYINGGMSPWITLLFPEASILRRNSSCCMRHRQLAAEISVFNTIEWANACRLHLLGRPAVNPSIALYCASASTPTLPPATTRLWVDIPTLPLFCYAFNYRTSSYVSVFPYSQLSLQNLAATASTH